MPRRKTRSNGYILVRMNERLTKRVDNICEKYGLSRAQVVRMLMVLYLDHLKHRIGNESQGLYGIEEVRD